MVKRELSQPPPHHTVTRVRKRLVKSFLVPIHQSTPTCQSAQEKERPITAAPFTNYTILTKQNQFSIALDDLGGNAVILATGE